MSEPLDTTAPGDPDQSGDPERSDGRVQSDGRVREAPRSSRAVRLARWRQSAAWVWRDYRRQRAGLVGLILLGVIIVVAIATPLLADPAQLTVTGASGARMAPPTDGYLLGTDERGRSVLLMIAWGAQVTLMIGVTAALLAMVIGTSIGVIAGHFEGRIGWVLMRITEWFMVLPGLVVAIALVAVLGRHVTVIVVAIGVTSWAGTARLIRAQTRAVEGRPYLERARALGAGHGHQMARHVLPNVMPLVLASTTLQVAGAILSESGLAFLGLFDPNAISWGMMLNRAWQAGAISAGAWWYLLPPGIMILLVVLCFTLCGRALEVAINPRLRR